MADDDKKPKKKPYGAKESAKKPAGPPPPAGTDGAADPAGDMAMDPSAGMPPGMGVSPPMPGSGIDPYAAMMGAISQTPPQGQPGMGGGSGMGMPMGTGAGGDIGGGTMGMGNAIAGPMLGQQGQPPDLLTHALMSGTNPGMSLPPDPNELQDPLGQMGQIASLNQLMTLLSQMQGGIPMSGLPQPQKPGTLSGGMMPAGMGLYG